MKILKNIKKNKEKDSEIGIEADSESNDIYLE